MERAIQLAIEQMEAGSGGPFGALIVKNNQLIAEGFNEVTSSSDPTAHAEIQAIRKACKKLGGFQLEGCELYTSCEPCPMCLGAIYWARPARVYFAASRWDAAKAGFDDDFIYKEIPQDFDKRQIPFIQLGLKNSFAPFDRWIAKLDRIPY